MGKEAGVEIARSSFTGYRSVAVMHAGMFVDDPEAVVVDAESRFEAMLPDLAYLDNPAAPMANALFGCTASLALYLALRDRGVDVHDFGRTMLAGMKRRPPPQNEGASDRGEWLPAFIEAGERSQREGKPGEFVYEVFAGDGDETDWGMNIKSCAICHQFSKFGAMDLVPYMCATDDVMSDHSNSGLRRTGTIGTGHDHCDFRYKDGGEPVQLVTRHPDKIKT